MKLILTLILTLLAQVAFANSPALPQNILGERAAYDPQLRKMISQQAADGQKLLRYVKVSYDPTINNNGAVGQHSLGHRLPKNAIIVRSFLYFSSAFTEVANAAAYIVCKDANSNIYATVKGPYNLASQSAGALVEGASTGSTATMDVTVLADCYVTASIASQAISSGLLDVYIEYVVHD